MYHKIIKQTEGVSSAEIQFPNVFVNVPVSNAINMAVKHEVGAIKLPTGGLVIDTGKYKGRCTGGRKIVDGGAFSDKIAWDSEKTPSPNKPVSLETFETLKTRIIDHLRGGAHSFDYRGSVGADPRYALPIRVVTNKASSHAFHHNIFIGGRDPKLPAEFTVLHAPDLSIDPKEFSDLKSDAFILINFEQKLAIIGGTGYNGEVKKTLFSVMNALLPEKGVFPMHNSAVVNVDGKPVLFFGLSGTGKTTLSMDPKFESIIGDDEHGWSEHGLFNFEGGAYAKTIGLTRETEPVIYDAIHQDGAIIENVHVNADGTLDFFDTTLGENGRVGFDISKIPTATTPSMVDEHPETVVFLTADAFGVLPPVALLTPGKAMYYFQSGYTAKVAGTEHGVKEPQPTFSTAFGEPFMPLAPSLYAEMLGDRIKQHHSRVVLINTGWVGGPYSDNPKDGYGERISIKATRAIVHAAVSGEIHEDMYFRQGPIFRFLVPRELPGVDPAILNPRQKWKSEAEYDAQANMLAKMFEQNMVSRFPNTPANIVVAGPKAVPKSTLFENGD